MGFTSSCWSWGVHEGGAFDILNWGEVGIIYTSTFQEDESTRTLQFYFEHQKNTAFYVDVDVDS